MITPADFRAKFSEFLSLPDSTIQPWIDEAALTIDVDDTVDIYDLCLLYLTAHLLSPSQSGGDGMAVGPVTARTDGRVSVTFADRGAAYSATGPNSSTPYGQRYDHLVATLGYELLVI